MQDQGQVRVKVMHYILAKAVLVSNTGTKTAFQARAVKSDSQVKVECLKTGTCVCECAHSSACNLPITGQFVHRNEGKARENRGNRTGSDADRREREREREKWQNVAPSLAGRE